MTVDRRPNTHLAYFESKMSTPVRNADRIRSGASSVRQRKRKPIETRDYTGSPLFSREFATDAHINPHTQSARELCARKDDFRFFDILADGLAADNLQKLSLNFPPFTVYKR